MAKEEKRAEARAKEEEMLRERERQIAEGRSRAGGRGSVGGSIEGSIEMSRLQIGISDEEEFLATISSTSNSEQGWSYSSREAVGSCGTSCFSWLTCSSSSYSSGSISHRRLLTMFRLLAAVPPIIAGAMTSDLGSITDWTGLSG